VKLVLALWKPDATNLFDEAFRKALRAARATWLHVIYASNGDHAELDRRLTKLTTSAYKRGVDRGLDVVSTSRYGFDLTC
jgi:hypothetical protein